MRAGEPRVSVTDYIFGAALRHNDPAFFEALIACPRVSNPLCNAVAFPERVERLLARPEVDVNAVGPGGRSPQALARNSKVRDLLVAAGATVGERSAAQENWAARWASEQGKPDSPTGRSGLGTHARGRSRPEGRRRTSSE
jgi:hypothetical protein